jgi:deoxyribodipyrimidine photolyase-related protein
MHILWLQDIHLNQSWLKSCALNRQTDLIFFTETRERYTEQAFHKQKIVFHMSAQRHYVETLRRAGYQVVVEAGETFASCLQNFTHTLDISHASSCKWSIVLPTDYWWRKSLVLAVEQAKIGSNAEFLEDDFLYMIPREQWPHLLPAQKKSKMEHLYQRLRRQFGILMDGEQPAGGQWNYDVQNRKPANDRITFIEALTFTSDDITNEVIALVDQQYHNHPGNVSTFQWPVTSEDAQFALDHFIENRLPDFGTYQDAMISGNPYMAHSLLSACINVGLLSPMDAVHAAEQAYRQGRVGLASAEGFIRQILGWREYVRGVYICAGEPYKQHNHFGYQNPLPAFYWGAHTEMNCIRTVVAELLDSAYSHHIQRLMVLCNFAVLVGIRPQEVNDWFHQMYIDSQDWVVTPNVIGMGLHADGGMMATKPYVSSAQYIKKMSNYCSSCKYSADIRTGANACPFNALYWAFIAEQADTLRKNHRMQMMVATWRKFSDEERANVLNQQKMLLEMLETGQI